MLSVHMFTFNQTFNTLQPIILYKEKNSDHRRFTDSFLLNNLQPIYNLFF